MSPEAESDRSAVASGLDVELRRGPQEYAESDTLYEFRTTFVEYYDRFREESGISDEKNQRLLEILADAQLNFREYEREFDRALARPKELTIESLRKREKRLDDFTKYAGRDLWVPVLEEAEEGIKKLLSKEEYGAWMRSMGSIPSFYFLHLGQPLEIRSSAQGMLAR